MSFSTIVITLCFVKLHTTTLLLSCLKQSKTKIGWRRLTIKTTARKHHDLMLAMQKWRWMWARMKSDQWYSYCGRWTWNTTFDFPSALCIRCIIIHSRVVVTCGIHGHGVKAVGTVVLDLYNSSRATFEQKKGIVIHKNSLLLWATYATVYV